MVVLAWAGFVANQNKLKNHPDVCSCEIASVSALIYTQENPGGRNFSCIFGNKKHFSRDCFVAKKLSIEEKRTIKNKQESIEEKRTKCLFLLFSVRAHF